MKMRVVCFCPSEGERAGKQKSSRGRVAMSTRVEVTLQSPVKCQCTVQYQ